MMICLIINDHCKLTANIFNYGIFSFIILPIFVVIGTSFPENFDCIGDSEERIRYSTGTTKYGANISIFDTDNVYYVSDNNYR